MNIPIELRKRIITAAVLIAVFVGIYVTGIYSYVGRLLMALLGVAAAAAASSELSAFSFKDRRVLRDCSTALFTIPALFTLLLTLTSKPSAASGVHGVGGGLALASVILYFLLFVVARNSLVGILEQTVSLCLGLILIGFGGSAWVAMAVTPAGPYMIAWLVLIVCFDDIAAYTAGSTLGGPKLCPAISPNKTISGAVGGIICATAIAIGTRKLVGLEITCAALLGIVIAVAAQAGDLAKSLLKRLWGVKESGNILPGHGGVLDRIDGLLAGGAVLYAAIESGFLSTQ